MHTSEMVRCLRCDEINWVEFKVPNVDHIENNSFTCFFCKQISQFKAITRVFCAPMVKDEKEFQQSED